MFLLKKKIRMIQKNQPKRTQERKETEKGDERKHNLIC